MDTGRLRGSLSWAIENEINGASNEDGVRSGIKNAVIVGTNVEYSLFVEDGTSKMGKRPFLRPAYDENKSKFATIIKKYIKEALK